MMARTLPLLIAAFIGIAQYRLRRMLLGIGLYVVSGMIGLFGVIIGLVGLFLALADVNSFVMPSLITGGIALLLAVALGIEGNRQLRR